MLIVIGSYARHGVEILANESAEYAIAGAVQNAHIFTAELNGIVEEIGDGLNGFVATHAANIDVRHRCGHRTRRRPCVEQNRYGIL